MPESKLYVRIYKPKRLEVGPVVLTVFELERIDELNTTKSIDEILTDYVERFQSTRKLIEVVRPGVPELGLAAYTAAYRSSRTRYRLLYPRPTKLLKIGVLVNGRWQWFQPPGEVYVFEGEVRVKDNRIDLILLVSEDGVRRILI